VHEWSAEVVVDERLARRLIAQRFPAVELRRLRLLAEGWDNTVWLVDDRWVFRFPRRALAIPGVEREIALLPRLAPLLPAPIPNPVFAAAASDDFPWPFWGAAHLPGCEPADARLSDAARERLARPLARFLRALHAPAVEAAIAAARSLPADPAGRADMARRVDTTERRLHEAEGLGLWRAPSSLRAVLDAARELPAPEPTAVAHGDLHLRHVLVDGSGDLRGVIDWGDLCRADPAIDLSLIWSLFGRDARVAFLDAYGPVSAEGLLRARVLAVFLCATLAVYAHHERMANLRAEALAGLARAAAD
jgi:aminoglycoside phosphotransferase (APT) family kinase protein